MKTAIIGINLDFIEYLTIENKFVQDNDRREKAIRKLESVYSKDISILKNDYEQKLKESFAEKYMELLSIIAKEIVEAKVEFAVFPEYTLPQSFLHPLLNQLQEIEENACFVLGTHLDRDNFNVSPIVFLNKSENTKKIYYQYKNYLSRIENAIGSAKRSGYGILKFHNVGSCKYNFEVLICSDAFCNIQPIIGDIDFVALPCFNPSAMFIGHVQDELKLFKRIKGELKKYNVIGLYSNTINEGDLCSQYLVEDLCRVPPLDTTKTHSPSAIKEGATENDSQAIEMVPTENKMFKGITYRIQFAKIDVKKLRKLRFSTKSRWEKKDELS
ncbi:MAG: hypothetical protein ACE5KZ_00080 [Candidatus Scalinduaceae bacterium]